MADKPKKRQIKPAETIREKSQKADKESSKDKKQRAAKSGVLRTIGRFIIPKYFRNAFHELRYVTWPSWKESRQLTTAVILFAVVFGFLITVIDYGLDKVFKKVFLKE